MRFHLSSRSIVTAAMAALLSLPAIAADFQSSRISVRTEGSGSDVVLIPGLSSSPRVWTEMIKAVPGHRYHMIQVQGFAGTPANGNKEGLVAAPVADEIARYIKETGLQKPAVIGHSMGGTMGMMLAARHPEAVSRLMVVDMMPFLGAMFVPPGAKPEVLKAIADSLEAGMRNATPEARKQKATATITSMVNTESMRDGALDDSLKSDSDVAIRAYRELILTDLMPELSNIAAPMNVLYVYPKGAPISESQIDVYYKLAYANAKNATLKRISDSAHFIMWDQPAQFQTEVKAFLKVN